MKNNLNIPSSFKKQTLILNIIMLSAILFYILVLFSN